jgi:hypothetical protein
MKVSELIAELQKYDPELDVRYDDDSCGPLSINEITLEPEYDYETKSMSKKYLLISYKKCKGDNRMKFEEMDGNLEDFFNLAEGILEKLDDVILSNIELYFTLEDLDIKESLMKQLESLVALKCNLKKMKETTK